ncbi:MAG: hypothetical protein R3E12_08420 [Candidatus Eisenbacteria bacterium]
MTETPYVDDLAGYEIPDEIADVHLETPIERFETRDPVGVWAYRRGMRPDSDALLFRISSRRRDRERALEGDVLSVEEKTRIDSLELRLIEPDAPRLTPVEKLQHQISVDLENETVLLTDTYEETPIAPPVRMSMVEYARRLAHESAHNLWAKEAVQEMSQAKTTARGGLVDLDIPIPLPKAVQSIFGPGEPSLKVSGSERITFAGTSRWRPYQVQDELGGRQSKFPQLNMEQQLNLKVSGTIGDKVQVDVDQASQSTTPLANRIQIHYKGYEDEIVQRVDLGNTSLRLPGTRYVTYNGRAEGLFGINTLAKIGDVDLNMVLSKQEGQNDSKSVTSSAEVTTRSIDDWQYVQRKYFFLRSPDDCPWEIDPNSIDVYVDDLNGRNNTQDATVPAIATADGTDDFPGREDAFREGQWKLLIGGVDYAINNYPYNQQPVLALSSPIDDNYYLAVTYEGWPLERRNDGSLVRVEGEKFRVGHVYSNDEPYRTLKMVRVARSNPGIDQLDLRSGPWKNVARLELRNVYDLGARNILAEGFQLRIRWRNTTANSEDPDRLPGNGPTFLQMTGIDLSKTTETGDVPGHDNKVDSAFLNTATGELYLPDLRPFDPDSTDLALKPARCSNFNYFRFDPAQNALTESRPESLGVPTWNTIDATKYRAPDIYDRATLTPAPEQYSRYYLDATFRSPVSRIQLNAFNILPGSERVTANTRLLTRDSHYRIDYDLGEVEILDAANVTESDDINVTYQYIPFGGGGGQKTLAGISAFVRPEESPWNVSSTWFFESKGGVPGVEGRRPRLGEEPSRTLVGELAAQYRTDSWLLTDLVNRLPYLDARQPSRIEIDTGIGISMPNPNTRNVLYIDDFEGAKDVLALSMSRKSWRFPAIPLEVLREEGSDSLKAASRRGELLWYSPRTALQEWDLQPTLETREGDDNRQMMELYLATNGDTEEEHRRSWVGITQPISIRGADLSQAQFLDIWINDGVPYEERHRREGTLYIDLGSVSEDAMWHQNDLFADPSTWTVVPPNGRFDTEDVSGDGVLDQSDTNDEDTGLDRLSDAQGDTSFDDYRFDLNSDAETYQPIQFRYVNGTEGNQNLDTEDLNDDLVPQRSNSYFELAIDLADSTLWETDVRRDFVVRDPGEPLTEVPADTSGWRRIRIPLADEKLVKIFKDVGVSDPVWERIFHARMWLTKVLGERQRIQFGGIEIIGNRWFERPLSDLRDVELSPTEVAPGEEFFVGVLNNKDDAAVYSPPFTPRDLPQENVQEREQSITLELRNFQPGHRAAIYRIFPREQNYSSLYETLEFYLNRRFVAGDASLVMSVRLSKDAASDTTNYYEYTRPLPDGWDEVKIDLAELSRLQLASPDSLTGKITQQLDDGAVISRKGTPSLTSVRRVTFTVTNVGRTPLSEGGVWIDEFRLSGVKKNTGTAKRLQVTAKLSDFMDFTGNFEKKGADFVSIGQDQGSGTTATTMNLSSRIALQKFIERTGVLLPLSWSYNKSRLIPKFKTNSDLVVDTPTDRDINEREDQQISLNYSKRRSDNAWMRYLVDPFSASYTRGHTVTLAPTQRDTTVTNAGSVNWQLGLDNVGVMRLPERGLPGFLGKPELQLLPTQLSASFSKRSTERQLYQRTDLSKPFVREETYSPTSTQLAMGMAASPIRAIRYKIDSSRDLNLRQVRKRSSDWGSDESGLASRAERELGPSRAAVALGASGHLAGWVGHDVPGAGGERSTRESPIVTTAIATTRPRPWADGSSRAVRRLHRDPQAGGRQGQRRGSIEVTGWGRGSAIPAPQHQPPVHDLHEHDLLPPSWGEPRISAGALAEAWGADAGAFNATRSTTDTKRFGWDTTVDLPINMSIKPRFGHDVGETNGNGVTNIRRSTTWPEFDLVGQPAQEAASGSASPLEELLRQHPYSPGELRNRPEQEDLISRTTTTRDHVRCFPCARRSTTGFRPRSTRRIARRSRSSSASRA